jgi:ABC-type nitrate/sulfonate/bicarbonate transport system ATPase subunit
MDADNRSVVVRDLVKRFGDFVALDQVSLEVRAGEIYGMLGPNGSGKSTLLRIIAGFEEPTTGGVSAQGKPITGPGSDRGMVFQDYALFPWMTVRQNIGFGPRQRQLSRDEVENTADEFVKLVGLGRFADRYPSQLSGGMKQRVALARALAMQPDVLLMDEPFAALDAQTRDLLHDELERVWRETGQTIIFVTHNVREAVRLGDRVLVLSYRPGRIKKEFLISLARPRHIEDSEVASMSKRVLGHLREEIDKSVRAEFHHEQFA